MKYTNKANLPEGIIRALESDDYSKGDADYSVSNLIQPPRVYQLTKRNWDKLTTDYSDEIWKLFGSSVHYILEKAQKQPADIFLQFIEGQLDAIKDAMSEDEYIDSMTAIKDILNRKPPEMLQTKQIEKRYYASIGGIKISGKPDRYDPLMFQLDDYKVTSVWKIMKGDYEDYKKQLNMYRWLLNENDLKVDTLRIVAILKDWKKYETYKEEYPKNIVTQLEIDTWDMLDTTEFILKRVRRHEFAAMIKDSSQLPLCTAEERWHKPDTFAVIKHGNKKASKVLNTREDANTYAEQLGPEYVVQDRLGEDTRCENYCIVKDFCSQYKDNHGGQTITTIDPPVINFIAEGSNTQIRGKETTDVNKPKAEEFITPFSLTETTPEVKEQSTVQKEDGTKESETKHGSPKDQIDELLNFLKI